MMSRNSISKSALKALSLRLSIVVIGIAIVGFWFNYRLIEERTIQELDMYTKERVERESIYFLMAQENLRLFEKAFRHEFQDSKRDFHQEFRQKFVRKKDGTYAPASKKVAPVQMFLKKGVPVTPQMEKSIVILNDLLLEFGFTWSANFHNVWASGIEDYGLAYWPARPEALSDLPSDHSFLIHEYMTVGLPKNNPKGKPRWTGPYFDIMSEDWMISINHPIYHEGKYLLSIGMDILLDNFFKRSIENVLPGTYNVVFMKDGRLVTHPELFDEIIGAEGNFLIGDQEDEVLKDIFRNVSRKRTAVVNDKENDLFLGTGTITGPGWHFVLVYPKSNLFSVARKTGLFIILVGFLTLIIELLMLYQVIQKHIARPIKNLIKATDKIAEGENAQVEVNNDNELGQLAKSFNIMSEKIVERDKLLSDQALKLEMQVQERSLELDTQRAKAFQAAKMATLGEISAGIAHEINNPLSTITLSAGGIRKRLEKGSADSQSLFPFITKIEDTANRISKIVKGMRAFSRNAEHDKIEPIYVRTIIENTLNLCEESLKKNDVALECSEIPEKVVMCREVEIIQTLLNLIQNAADALATTRNKKIKIWFRETKNQLSIVVEDNGPGVPKEIEDKIMNPFFTTKEVGKGTGLGLFISMGLVKSNNGTLVLEQVEKGTRFIVTLNKG